MKNRHLTTCIAFLLAFVMCFLTVGEIHAISVNPNDAATEENVLELLRQYDPDAYHIMTTKTGIGFMTWFMGGSIISGIDTAVHETYHGYTHSQSDEFYGERIYLGDGKSYDVDYSVVYKGGTFTKTEEMSKQIPSQLQTFRYKEYVAPGASPDANTKGVFGLLNEFTAYYWGLETMNSLAQFLTDSNAGADSWESYVTSIGNNITAYAEFKYWTLRYMLYIKSANPTLYQAVLNNQNYCAAYRDSDALFISEIARSKEIINNSAEYMRSKGFSIDWSDSGIYLKTDPSSSGENEFSDPWGDDFFDSMWDGGFGSWSSSFSSTGSDLGDYSSLMAELETAEYIEMDSVLKNAASKQVVNPAKSFTDVPKWCAEAVAWAAEKGITKGTDGVKRTFSPNTTCNQAQILTFLWRAKGKPNPVVAVNSTNYYSKAVQWAKEQGVIDNFSAEAPCTRAMVVTYLWKVMGSPNVGSARFSDVATDSSYAQPVAWAVANGITTGTSSTTFSPNDTCTRGQIVTFLHRLLAK